jgi:hypothetical protein
MIVRVGRDATARRAHSPVEAGPDKVCEEGKLLLWVLDVRRASTGGIRGQDVEPFLLKTSVTTLGGAGPSSETGIAAMLHTPSV